MKKTNRKTNRNMIVYRFVRFLSQIVSKLIFKRKILHNEIRGKKGPYVVIANHQASLDFVNLIGMTRTPLNFVISQSFYQSSPVKWFMTKIGVIPKQQFQTTLKDMRAMKSVIDDGEALVIYPAGLMCEDGLSTPIPVATYQFLKWLRADVYVARVSGSYFVMPKWTRGMRSGRTYMDVYKLFSAEELAETDVEMIKQKTDEALLFDAYREQEKLLVKYQKNDQIEGLQHVLYMCPHCKREFTMQVKDQSVIYCTECGFEQMSDEYGFLHHNGEVGEEIRYVSDWSRMIYDAQKQRIESGEETELSAKTQILVVDPKRHKFVHAGEGRLTLTPDHMLLVGEVGGEALDVSVSTATFASLPFSPGRYLELQHGDNIYRCMLEDGKLAMKFINMIKAYYELHVMSCEHAK